MHVNLVFMWQFVNERIHTPIADHLIRINNNNRLEAVSVAARQPANVSWLHVSNTTQIKSESI